MTTATRKSRRKFRTFGELFHEGAFVSEGCHQAAPTAPTFFEVHRAIHLGGIASLARNVGGKWVVMYGEYRLFPLVVDTKREAVQMAGRWEEATKDRWQSKQSVES